MLDMSMLRVATTGVREPDKDLESKIKAEKVVKHYKYSFSIVDTRAFSQQN